MSVSILWKWTLPGIRLSLTLLRLFGWKVCSLKCVSHLIRSEPPQQVEFTVCLFKFSYVNSFWNFVFVPFRKTKMFCFALCSNLCFVYLKYFFPFSGVFRENARSSAGPGDLQIVRVWVWNFVHLQKDPSEARFGPRQTGEHLIVFLKIYVADLKSYRFWFLEKKLFSFNWLMSRQYFI